MTLKLALAFAEQGYAVFPLKLWRDHQQQRWRKNPLVKDDRQRRATTDPNRIKSSWDYWSRELANENGAELVPGLPLGRSGLVVVDCDRHANAPDGVAAWRTTPASCHHHPQRWSTSLLSAACQPHHQNSIVAAGDRHHWRGWVRGWLCGAARADPGAASCLHLPQASHTPGSNYEGEGSQGSGRYSYAQCVCQPWEGDAVREELFLGGAVQWVHGVKEVAEGVT